MFKTMLFAGCCCLAAAAAAPARAAPQVVDAAVLSVDWAAYVGHEVEIRDVRVKTYDNADEFELWLPGRAIDIDTALMPTPFVTYVLTNCNGFIVDPCRVAAIRGTVVKVDRLGFDQKRKFRLARAYGENYPGE